MLKLLIIAGMAAAQISVAFGGSAECIKDTLRRELTTNFPAFSGRKIDPVGLRNLRSGNLVDFGVLPEGAEVYELGSGHNGTAYRIQLPDGRTEIRKVYNAARSKEHDFKLFRGLKAILGHPPGPLAPDHFRIVDAESINDETLKLEDVQGQTVYNLVSPTGAASSYLTLEEKQALIKRFDAAWDNLYSAIQKAHRLGRFDENIYLGLAPYTLKYLTDDGEGLVVKLIQSNVILDQKTGDLVIIDPS